MAATGELMVVWDSETSPGDDAFLSVQGQRYALDGSPVGSQFQVNTSTTGYQYHSAVAMAAGGEFVVVWHSDAAAGDGYYGVQAQRFAADGSPTGGEIQINAYTTGVQYLPDVAIAADGSFLVVWSSEETTGSDTSSFSVQGRHFAADGIPLSPDFQVNTYTTSGQGAASVAFGDDGRFVVAWHSDGSPGDDSIDLSVQARRFDITAIFSDGFEAGDPSAWTIANP